MTQKNHYPSFTVLRSALLSAGLALVLGACSTTHYQESADKEVYQILDEKSPEVPGMTKEVNIEPNPAPDLSGLATISHVYEYLMPGVNQPGSPVLSLEKALDIGFTHSRDYQTQKEQLYLRALALTLDRHEFAPIFSDEIAVTHVWDSHDEVNSTIARAVDTMTGPAGSLLQQYSEAVSESGVMSRGSVDGFDTEPERDTSIEGVNSFGFSMLFKSGARLATSITSNFFKFLSGQSGDDATTVLAATLTQPLLRGAGKDVTTEFLTQSERDVLYQLRDFTDFRREFAVRIAAQYYSVLRAADAAYNNYQGLKSLERSLDRERAFQAEGLKTAADVARLDQSKLQRELSWTNSVRAYSQALDNFKILIGIPTDTKMVLDEAELSRLRDLGVSMPKIGSDEAIQLALVTRLDLYTQRDVVQDAERRIKVAANQLKPGLDVVMTGRVDSKDSNRFATLDFERSRWSAGAVLDLPLDRKAERNAYRRSLIDYELATREATLAEDNVKLDVRNAYRSLLQAEKDYEISQISLNLNKSRVEEVSLRAELGLGSILDQVDAQNDLTAAESSVTAALVDFQIALLQFWRDIGILYVKDNGMWEDIKDV